MEELDKSVALRREIKELAELVDRGRKRIEFLQEELEKCKLCKLSISTHAIQRFKERVENLPTKVIKSLIWKSDLREKYLKNGPGRHKLNNKPTVIAVIKDYTVITILNVSSPELKLQHLEQYMDYWIEKRCQEDYLLKPTLSFREFTKNLYK